MRLVERIRDRRLLWLDHLGYSASLPGGGYAWCDASASIAQLRRAQALLRADVVELQVAPIVASWLAAQAGLREALAATPRPAHAPLRELLRPPDLRRHLADIAVGLRAACRDELLALVLPSPRDWVAFALAQAGGEPGLADDEDAVDAGAACMAEFLRGFAGSGIDVLCLRETRCWFDDDAGLWAELLQPLANVAAHYGWDWGAQLPRGFTVPGTLGAQFVIVDAPCAFGGAQGIEVEPGFWEAGPRPAELPGSFDFATVPVAARPEDVLASLQRSRNA